MIDRRRMLAAAGAALAMPGTAVRARAAPAATLRVASLKFGSLGWLIETIRAEGLDKAAGLDIQVVEVATNQAGPIALMSGDADVIVSDWPWAMRQRSLGEPVRFRPFSSALGSVMVPKDSAIKTVKDLEGRKLGIAGSAIDKSWLLLRAYSRKVSGADIADKATPVYGAAPLLAQELRSGRIDACLNFWTYAARLAGAGFVELVSMAAVLKELGIEPVPALVGYIYKEKTLAEKGAAISAFLVAAEKGNAILAQSDEAWKRLTPLVKPASDVEMAAIVKSYRDGIPGGWSEAHTRSAEKLMALLADAGDKELMGHGTRFDAKLFEA